MITHASTNEAAQVVACPKCHAPAGEPCRAQNHRGKQNGVRSHKERLDLAKEPSPEQSQ